MFGGNAVSDEYHIGRHVSNLFVTQTYEGQSDIHGEHDWTRKQLVQGANQYRSSHSRPRYYRTSGILLESWHCPARLRRLVSTYLAGTIVQLVLEQGSEHSLSSAEYTCKRANIGGHVCHGAFAGGARGISTHIAAMILCSTPKFLHGAQMTE